MLSHPYERPAACLPQLRASLANDEALEKRDGLLTASSVHAPAAPPGWRRLGTCGCSVSSMYLPHNLRRRKTLWADCQIWGHSCALPRAFRRLSGRG